MKGTNAVSPKKSRKKKGGNLVHPSEQAVVAHSTQIGEPLSKDAQSVKVFLAIFQALLSHTYSPDVLYLSLRQARRQCPELSDEQFKEISNRIMNWNDALTANDPIRKMF